MTIKKLLFLIIFFISCSVNFNVVGTTRHEYDVDSTSLNISATNGSIDYLIITTEYFETALEPLAKWKTQKGAVSKIEVISDINQQYSGGDLPEKIKNCIIDYHSNNNTQWVLLAGDNYHVPTKYIVCDDGYPDDGNVVCCDSYYGDIDNDWTQVNFDYEAEVYIGRLAANNNAEMNSLVQRLLNYEKNPPLGAWMSQALFAGAILQFDQDWNNSGFVDYGECDGNRVNHYINNTIVPDNWSTVFLAQNQGIKGSDYYSDAELDYIHLKNAIDQGCSIGTILAHGNPLRMSIGEWTIDYDGDMLFDLTGNPMEGGTAIDVMTWESLFETSFVDLRQEDELGIYYLGGCSVGTFNYAEDCIAEYFLKNVGIGCISGSYVVWGEDQWYERDHGGWFVDGLGYRFWEQLFTYNQPGKALALAKADYAADRNFTLEPREYPEWSNKTLKQFNLLGDPEVPIWLSIPKQLNVSIDQPYNDTTNLMTLKVTANNNPIQGAIITYTENNDLIWKGETNENGTIDVPFSQIKIDNKVFTASKNGFLPYQAYLPVSEDSNGIAGYDVFGISFIILSFIFITSIYHKRSLSKQKSI